jgi:hypothetical protein
MAYESKILAFWTLAGYNVYSKYIGYLARSHACMVWNSLKKGRFGELDLGKRLSYGETIGFLGVNPLVSGQKIRSRLMWVTDIIDQPYIS